MSAQPSELHTLASRFEHAHGTSVAELACLVQLSNTLFSHFSKTYATDLTPLLTLQRSCVDLMASVQGFNPEDIDAALAGLSQTNRTVTYLSQLPD